MPQVVFGDDLVAEERVKILFSLENKCICNSAERILILLIRPEHVIHKRATLPYIVDKRLRYTGDMLATLEIEDGIRLL